jgi:acyl-CoA reductase-like NAD-dependent aldehyde dehydrogenase
MSIDMLGTVPIGPSIEKGTVVAELTITAPDDGSVLGTIGSDDRASIDAKVRAAENAMAGWAAASPMHRAEVLLQIAAATREALPELAAALSKEQGKTRKEALLELDRYVGPFVQYAGLATVVGGRHQQLGGGVQGHVERGPVGVVAAVVPWNFPASLFGSKLAPALAAGCGFLIKPAETTPLITRRLAGIAQQFLPPGLLDVVVGGPEIGELLVTHPQVARVAFTGSTAVGRRIAARAGEELKRLSLELGGCDPFVLLEDADLKGAVRALMGTRFYNAGQVCVAPKRLVVHERVADEVIALLTARIERVEPGPGLAPDSTMGPLHTEAGRARLEEQVGDAVDAGAELVGGGRPEGAHLSAGWFLRPALLLDPPPGTRVRTEETFGPVLTVVRVRDDDAAVAVANETAYGLGASVWSADRDRAWSVARRVPAGYTWINALGRVYDELPFGGVRASGMGREHGLEALESYLEDRTFIY